MTGWKRIDGDTPGGTYAEVNTGKGVRRVFVPAWIFVWHPSTPDKAVRTHWIPAEKNGDGGRFNGFTQDSPPLLWHAPPLPPTPENLKDFGIWL